MFLGALGPVFRCTRLVANQVTVLTQRTLAHMQATYPADDRYYISSSYEQWGTLTLSKSGGNQIMCFRAILTGTTRLGGFWPLFK